MRDTSYSDAERAKDAVKKTVVKSEVKSVSRGSSGGDNFTSPPRQLTVHSSSYPHNSSQGNTGNNAHA
jgi:succinyl-CoA synthetase beta subunit